MGGEDLRKVAATNSGVRDLPIHIDQFLRIPDLRMLFLLTASWKEAKNSDRVISEFLDYLNEKNPELLEKRVVLLITKWDSYPAAVKTSVEDFVRKQMPATFGKLRNPKNLIGSYSVGKVIPMGADGKESPDDIIHPFDYAQGQKLFNRICETFTGKTFIKKPSFFFKNPFS